MATSTTKVHPLRTLWTAAGFRTASALAEAAGVSHATIGNAERGTMPSTAVIEKLASVLDVEEAELYRQLVEHREKERAAAKAAAAPGPLNWSGDSELPQADRAAA